MRLVLIAMPCGQAIWSFVSGQTPFDPRTMKLVGSSIEAQTHRVLDNLSIVLAGVGLSLKDIVKTTVYLFDMNDFQGMNKVYAERFQGHTPSRTTISIKKNPLDALVEIESTRRITITFRPGHRVIWIRSH